ncbi:LON-domain-containing protein [Dendrothele bispora CBS 962.96]|uniref:LON-domain-containing protein n=1 Tax=Dendrothele bispora (strain CBS 962.96) TaxID=1314807 RepID=A0A4S8MYL5_DENBC|nr:LON-domain-containing protein [Dendrothele bispora CBS 962.96]
MSSNLPDLLKCAVCGAQLVNPTTLKCGHTICTRHSACTLHPQPVTSDHRVDVSLKKIIALSSKHRQSNSTDSDLLSHLLGESARQRATRPDEPLIPSQDDSTSLLEKELLAECTCEICYTIFFEPMTTPCQHTFCSRCLHRSLDHSTLCPLCREQLPSFAHFQNHPTSELMLRILLDAFPEIYQEREQAIHAEERDARLSTPIFVCHLSFPGMPILLHFFEPRYRLMLRRCLASPRPAFGMIMSSSSSASSSSSSTLNSQGQVEYGTMLEIRSVQMLPDGRSMVETWGTHRFRILERGIMDGYVVARVERIDDYPDDPEDELEGRIEEVSQTSSSSSLSRISRSSPSPPHPPSSPSSPRSRSQFQPSNTTQISVPTSSPQRPLPLSTAALIAHCNSFLAQLHTNTTPWVVQRLSYTHGPPPPSPDDPSFDAGNFSFYVGTVLPIDEWEKAKLLPVRSVRMRLKMCVWWIEGLRRNWWFERGCVVL